MPDQMTLEQFGQKIKAKYPQYSSLSDTDVANKVIAKYPQYKSSIIQAPPTSNPNALHPEARTAGNYGSEIARGVGRGLKNDVVGAYETVRHPIDTVTGLATQGRVAAKAASREWRENASAPLAQRVAASALGGMEEAPVIGGMVQRVEQGGTELASPEGVGAAAEGITTFAAPEPLVEESGF